MKKIGIVTFYNAHNYGAMLQAMALQDYLKEQGNEVYIINYRNKIIDKRYNFCDWNGNKFICLIKNIIKFILYYKKYKIRYNSFEKFIDENFNLSKQYNLINELKQNPPEYDIYVTGSDQVWNHKITSGLDDIYTLNFGNKKICKVSYAASIGNDKIDSKMLEEYRKKLSSLDYISVRETTAKKQLSKILNKDIYEVLDPTLLYDKKYWNKKIENIKKEKEKYILAYQIDSNPEYNKIVNYLSKKTGYKVIYFEMRNKNSYDSLRNAFTSSPLEFISLIKNAEYVVNTSFHGTVFSILFEKKFFVVPHKETGSRMVDFLKKLKLSNRIFYTFKDFLQLNYDMEIGYNTVNKILESERIESKKYIDTFLKNSEVLSNENINNNTNL